MKKISVTIIQIAIHVHMAWAGELTAISSKFVNAAKDGDIENLASTLWNGGPAKEEMIAEFKEVVPEIKEGKLKITRVDRELIIGELGITLMRLDSEDDKAPHYNPIICLKVEGKWLIFPWATEEHLQVLFDQRSKEEQIHLKLFNEWSNLMEKLLAEETKREGPAQPATKPRDKAPVKSQTTTPAPEDARRQPDGRP